MRDASSASTDPCAGPVGDATSGWPRSWVRFDVPWNKQHLQVRVSGLANAIRCVSRPLAGMITAAVWLGACSTASRHWRLTAVGAKEMHVHVLCAYMRHVWLMDWLDALSSSITWESTCMFEGWLHLAGDALQSAGRRTNNKFSHKQSTASMMWPGLSTWCAEPCMPRCVPQHNEQQFS